MTAPRTTKQSASSTATVIVMRRSHRRRRRWGGLPASSPVFFPASGDCGLDFVSALCFRSASAAGRSATGPSGFAAFPRRRPLQSAGRGHPGSPRPKGGPGWRPPRSGWWGLRDLRSGAGLGVRIGRAGRVGRGIHGCLLACTRCAGGGRRRRRRRRRYRRRRAESLGIDMGIDRGGGRRGFGGRLCRRRSAGAVAGPVSILSSAARRALGGPSGSYPAGAWPWDCSQSYARTREDGELSSRKLRFSPSTPPVEIRPPADAAGELLDRRGVAARLAGVERQHG